MIILLLSIVIILLIGIDNTLYILVSLAKGAFWVLLITGAITAIGYAIYASYAFLLPHIPDLNSYLILTVVISLAIAAIRDYIKTKPVSVHK